MVDSLKLWDRYFSRLPYSTQSILVMTYKIPSKNVQRQKKKDAKKKQAQQSTPFSSKHIRRQEQLQINTIANQHQQAKRSSNTQLKPASKQ